MTVTIGERHYSITPKQATVIRHLARLASFFTACSQCRTLCITGALCDCCTKAILPPVSRGGSGCGSHTDRATVAEALRAL